ncbi:MAG: acyltransferase family protein [Acidimicrobiia bacterium]|nr:acyltransferase family protein [Acidimicrobiia bacterium]
MNGTTAITASATTAAPIPSPPPASEGLGDLAARTPPERNRAVDLYRAVAMIVVAVGHWLGMVAVLGDGELVAGNLLDFSPGYGWVTWIGQVMPLFFFVGGYASASSLRSAERDGVRPADWVATRLHRMVAPAAALGGFWLVALLVGGALGGGEIVVAGAIGAAIPLWFLANYTIDTALAPFTFRWFRRRPGVLVGVLAGAFALAEAANLAGIPVIPQLNWVIGWLGFQVAGFAWREGRLPDWGTARRRSPWPFGPSPWRW